jgi:hypothetical protein
MTVLLIKKVNIMMVYPLMKNTFCFQIKCATKTCIVTKFDVRQGHFSYDLMLPPSFGDKSSANR